ncbi:MAG: hypothetical protein LBR21_06105 [Propionibacteriaceae bacterium]|jgi:Arc/MetJ-type ribon-helix-helix transcriptional regulator|nr:hypothetical protein [Propionibacteriaceae bacterium]
MKKERITVTVSKEIVDFARAQVGLGEADSLSDWVAQAMEEKAERYDDPDQIESRWQEIWGEYQQEYGQVSAEDLELTRREMEQTAIYTGQKKRSRS